MDHDANVKFEFFLDRTPVCNPLYTHDISVEVIDKLQTLIAGLIKRLGEGNDQRLELYRAVFTAWISLIMMEHFCERLSPIPKSC